MKNVIKPWNDGGNLTATYEGVGDGSAVFSSDIAEGLDREMNVSFVDKYRSVVVEKKVKQVGMRERFVCADGVFILAGGGTFNVLKPSKQKYQRIEYIANTSGNSGAYIDTGFIPNNKTRVIFEYAGEDDSVAVYIFGVYGRTSGKLFQLRVLSSGANYTLDWGTNSTKSTGVAIGERDIIDLNRNVCTIKGKTITVTDVEFVCETNLKLLAGATTAGADRVSNGIIYSCKIYDDDVLVRDFVPAIWEDGRVGLVDVLTETFYPSANDAEFIAGNKIE